MFLEHVREDPRGKLGALIRICDRWRSVASDRLLERVEAKV